MKIKVEPLFPTGSFLNVRLGVEIDIPDDGNMRDEIFTMWDNLIAIHRERYPQLYAKTGEPLYEPYQGEEMRGTITRVVEEKPKLSNEDKKKQQIAGFVEAITTCKSLKTLTIFKALVDREKLPELNEAYENTKKRLENE